MKWKWLIWFFNWVSSLVSQLCLLSRNSMKTSNKMKRQKLCRNIFRKMRILSRKKFGFAVVSLSLSLYYVHSGQSTENIKKIQVWCEHIGYTGEYHWNYVVKWIFKLTKWKSANFFFEIGNEKLWEFLLFSTFVKSKVNKIRFSKTWYLQ